MTFDEMVAKRCDERIESLEHGLGTGAAASYEDYANSVGQIRAYRDMKSFVLEWRENNPDR